MNMQDPMIAERAIEDGDIDLRVLGSRILSHPLVLGACVACAILVAVIYLHLAQWKYTVELSVTPVDTGSSGISASLGGLSGLASMVGVNLPTSQNVSPFDLYVQSLRTREVAEAIIKDEDLTHVVFRREWDERSRTWHEPQSVLRGVARAAAALLGVPLVPWRVPDAARLQDFLERNLDVEQDSKTKVLTISLAHENPEFAIKFLSALDRAVDEGLRRRALARARSNIEYLSQKLNTISVVEYRQAIAQTMSDQEKLIMMASSTAPFAAEPFGRPTASSRPTSPNAYMVLLIAAVIGAIGGSMVSLRMSAT